MRNIDEIRSDIDSLDLEIAGLILKRMNMTDELAECKISSGSRIFDKEKENAKLSMIADLSKDTISQRGMQDIFRQILAIGRKKEYHQLGKIGAAGRLPFIAVDAIERENIRVVFQGVEGAYSHAAMKQFFGEQVNCFHVNKFRDAMEAIAEGSADYAVLPIENSSAGIVADNFDLLVDFENYIVGEQVIRCEHVLMGLPGTSLKDIKTVYSHPQALAQCEAFLDQHREWRQVPFDNTALAARNVAEERDCSQAAIGSAFAAQLFGLEVLQEQIYFNSANSTRFIIITNQRIFRKDAKKISICFELPHHSGSLYSILSHLIYNDLNMNRIESRPIPGQNWKYRFFIDFDGNLNQSSVKNALRGIRGEAINMKILGNY